MKKNVFFLLLCLLINSRGYAQSKVDTLYVSQNESAAFQSIQDAIDSVRAFLDHKTVINIDSAVYNEKIVIPSWCQNIELIGEDKETTIISYDDHSGRVVDGVKLTTFTSFTMLVQGNGIQLKNITVKNTSCNQGQAVALHVEGDRFSAINTNILGCQDTLYLGAASSRQYYNNCLIEGTTDFIFGSSTAFFENCTIKSLKNSFITAASTPKENRYGMVFYKCTLTAKEGIDTVHLGRPWRPYASTVFIQTTMGSHIVPKGWDPWDGDKTFPNKDKTAYYAEYKSEGCGAASKERVHWSHQLTKSESLMYRKNQVLGDNFGKL
jgi:pectinesterase